MVTLGVETDVLGLALEEITPEQRAEAVAAHPRPDFGKRILQSFYDGMATGPTPPSAS